MTDSTQPPDQPPHPVSSVEAPEPEPPRPPQPPGGMLPPDEPPPGPPISTGPSPTLPSSSQTRAPGAAGGTRAARRHDASWVGGAVLIALGVLLLIGQAVPDLGRFVTLIVGLALLTGFVVTRTYGFLVPGCIVSGVGVGIVLTGPDDRGGLFLISLGGGFLAIWLLGLLFRLRENHWWPIIPGAILGTIGLVAYTGERPRELVTVVWPVIFVVLGLIVIVRAVGFGRREG